MVNWSEWSADRIDRFDRAIAHQVWDQGDEILYNAFLLAKPSSHHLLQHPLHSTLPALKASVQLFDITLHPAVPDHIRAKLHRPGEGIFDRSSNSLVILCADDELVGVCRLQTENRKEANAKDWWNGVKAKEGILDPSRGTVIFI